MRSNQWPKDITFEEWVRQGNELVKNIRQHRQQRILTSNATITLPRTTDGTDEESSLPSTLTTLSSSSLQLQGACIVIEGFEAFYERGAPKQEEDEVDEENQARDMEELFGGIEELDCNHNTHSQTDSMDAGKHDKGSGTLPQGETENRTVSNVGRLENRGKNSASTGYSPISCNQKTFRKRSTFQGISRKNKKQKSKAPYEEQVTIAITHEEMIGSYLSLLEGVTDIFRNDEETARPTKGRIHEIAPLNSMLAGDWTVHLKRTSFCNDSTNPATKNSSKGPTTRIIFRHEDFFKHEMKEFNLDKPLSEVANQELELRMVNPELSRAADLISQAVVTSNDLCFVQVTSLSLFAFKGFSSSSECRAQSRELSQYILSQRRATFGVGCELQEFQLSHEPFGCLAGATYVLHPGECKACCNVIVAVDRKRQEIVAVEVTLSQDKKDVTISFPNDTKEEQGKTGLLTKDRLEMWDDINEMHGKGRHVKRPHALVDISSSKVHGTDQPQKMSQVENGPTSKRRRDTYQHCTTAPHFEALTKISQQAPVQNTQSLIVPTATLATCAPQEQRMKVCASLSQPLPWNMLESAGHVVDDTLELGALSDSPLRFLSPTSEEIRLPSTGRAADSQLIVASEYMLGDIIGGDTTIARPTPSIKRSLDFRNFGNRALNSHLPLDVDDEKFKWAERVDKTTSTIIVQTQTPGFRFCDATPRVHFTLEPRVSCTLVTPASMLRVANSNHATPDNVTVSESLGVPDFSHTHCNDPVDTQTSVCNDTEDQMTPPNSEEFTAFHDVFFGCHDELAVVYHESHDIINLTQQGDDSANLADVLHGGFIHLQDDYEDSDLLVNWLSAILLLTVHFALLYWINFSLLDDPWKMLEAEVGRETEYSTLGLIWSMLGF